MSLAQEFMELFAGLSRAYGTYQVLQEEDTGKQTGQAVTKRAAVTEELWTGHLNGKLGIGIVPINDDNTCMFGAIDVDGNSGKYREFDAAEFARRAAEMNLPITVCRSKSGGAHIYLFADSPVSAASMQARLRNMLPYFGLPKDVEIFPKQTRISSSREDIGSWINMPYFDVEQSVRYAFSATGERLTAQEFLAIARTRRQSAAFFGTPIAPPTNEQPQILVENPKAVKDPGAASSAWFPDGPPCLQQLGVDGIPDGNRNNAMLNVGRYFKIIGDGWRDKARECNAEIFDPPLEPAELNLILRQVEGRGYQYTCRKEPLLSKCNGAVCRGRKYGVGRDGKGGIGAPGVPKEVGEVVFSQEGVSDGFPVLGQLRKLTTSFGAKDAIKYFLDVDGEPLELDPLDLEEPRRFRSRVLHSGRKGTMIDIPTSESWTKMVNDLTSRMIIVELPEESSKDGLFWSHFTNFCHKFAGRAKDEIIHGKTWENEGRVWFQLISLIENLRRYKYLEISPAEISAVFQRRNVISTTIVIRGLETSVWGAPKFSKRTPKEENPDEEKVL